MRVDTQHIHTAAFAEPCHTCASLVSDGLQAHTHCENSGSFPRRVYCCDELDCNFMALYVVAFEIYIYIFIYTSCNARQSFCLPVYTSYLHRETMPFFSTALLQVALPLSKTYGAPLIKLPKVRLLYDKQFIYKSLSTYRPYPRLALLVCHG